MSDLKLLFVSDEALAETPPEGVVAGAAHMSPYDRLLLQGRYLGVGYLGAGQLESGFSPITKSNVTTLGCLRCNPKEAREVGAMLGLTEKQSEKLPHLPVGHMIFRSVGFGGAVEIWMPNFSVGDLPGNAEVEQLLAGERQWLAEHTIYSPNESDAAVPLNMAEILGEPAAVAPTEPVVVDDVTRARFLSEHRQLLQEIHDHPSASVTEHYRNCSWSVGRGNRVKNQLVEMKLVRIERQKSNAGRPIEILLLTDTGKELLNGNTD